MRDGDGEELHHEMGDESSQASLSQCKLQMIGFSTKLALFVTIPKLSSYWASGHPNSKVTKGYLNPSKSWNSIEPIWQKCL